jgi:uncharacterized protein YegJ (DUF2314 family)
LDDAEERHREAPDTFLIPTVEARRNLEPGQIVKLLFVIPADPEEQVERMWVVVTGREGDGYIGELDNQPVSSNQLRPGMKVRFEPRHVIAIHRQRVEPSRSAP